LRKLTLHAAYIEQTGFVLADYNGML